MRSKKRPENKHSRVSKKARHQSRRSWGLKNNTNSSSVVALDNLSAVIRLNRTRQAEGKGSWKVMPKDSCEIYKERRKRQIEAMDNTDDTSIEMSEESKKIKEKKKPRKRSPTKRKKTPMKKVKSGLRGEKRRRR